MSVAITGGDSPVISGFWIPIPVLLEGFSYIYKSCIWIRLRSPS